MARKDIGGLFSFWQNEPNFVNPGKSKQIRGYVRRQYQGKAIGRPFPGTLDIKVKGREKPIRVKKSYLKRVD